MHHDVEPTLSRGEWLTPAAGYHSYPPRLSRFDAPYSTCARCGCRSQTRAPRCPVCDARFKPRWRDRVRARLRG